MRSDVTLPNRILGSRRVSTTRTATRRNVRPRNSLRRKTSFPPAQKRFCKIKNGSVQNAKKMISLKSKKKHTFDFRNLLHWRKKGLLLKVSTSTMKGKGHFPWNTVISVGCETHFLVTCRAVFLNLFKVATNILVVKSCRPILNTIN